MQPIEGITPGDLWIFLYVLVALAALILLIDKVIDVFRRYKQRKEAGKPELADEIAGKVKDQLKPTFEEIDRKLANDKQRLDGHDRELGSLTKRMDQTESGIRVLIRGMLAMMEQDPDEQHKAMKSLKDYLIDK